MSTCHSRQALGNRHLKNGQNNGEREISWLSACCISIKTCVKAPEFTWKVGTEEQGHHHGEAETD